MSWYLANESEILGQCASIAGLSDLTKAVDKWGTPALKTLLRDGACSAPLNCIIGLNAIVKKSKDADVKSTAQGMAKLMEGEKGIVCITQGFANDHSAHSESLKHQKHAASLDPIRAGIVKLMQRFFRRQRTATLKQIDGQLRILGGHERRPVKVGESASVMAHPFEYNPRDGRCLVCEEIMERHKTAHDAISEADQQSKDIVASALPLDTELPAVLSTGLSVDYGKLIEAAVGAGYGNLAKELSSNSEISPDVMGDYLRENSLTKLTGDINATTVERLRNAIADSYEAGGDYEDMKTAVKEVFAQANDVRAGLIAQTEANDAYNTGRRQLGLDMGFNEKSWAVDSLNPCPECVGNVLDGWIGMTETFSSGDEIPTAHPGCFCSLNVRFSASAEPAA